ncbi:hypothetical protein DXT99_00775 [Pontibacter diazotrophicus]|uniref:Uncharacterized protein n=1 Tax=Pontibacter diazotrophicus TaxID=1400979 RepID=A0A3D8LJ80_9BACT|nr:hypothetical protein [Pontibacter diazotrophicus]RDV17082.1 hypothetical protein DXT99_00775 [Pontibacter diazotrophicus]
MRDDDGHNQLPEEIKEGVSCVQSGGVMSGKLLSADAEALDHSCAKRAEVAAGTEYENLLAPYGILNPCKTL